MARNWSIRQIAGEYRPCGGGGQGTMTIEEARAEAARLNNRPAAEPEVEITSGLGIGGSGSDDYNIHTETPSASYAPPKSSRRETRADCGHLTAWPMSASLGTACPDCYDRMSD